MTKESCVSATPIRRRATRAVALAALSLALLAGCTTHQRDATNYGDTKDNFLKGCIATAKADNESGDAKERISQPAAWCECVFKAIEKNVDFDDFNKINSQMRDDGGALPKSITKAYASCDPSEGA